MRERDLVGPRTEHAPQPRPQIGLDSGHVGRIAWVGGALVLEGEAFLDVVDDRLGRGADPARLEVGGAGRGGNLGACEGHPVLGTERAGRPRGRASRQAGRSKLSDGHDRSQGQQAR